MRLGAVSEAWGWAGRRSDANQQDRFVATPKHGVLRAPEAPGAFTELVRCPIGEWMGHASQVRGVVVYVEQHQDIVLTTREISRDCRSGHS